MTKDEIFDFIQEEIGYNNISIKAAEKLYDTVKNDITHSSRKEIIAACIRIKGVQKGQPARIKKISDTLDVESKEVAKLCKKIKKEQNIEAYPDTKEYASFLLERLDINSISKEKIIKKTIDEAEKSDSMIGKPPTSIGFTIVYIETDIDIHEISDEVVTSPATIRNGENEIEEILSDE